MKKWFNFIQIISLFCVCLFAAASCTPKIQVSNYTKNPLNHRIVLGTTLKPRTLDPADAYELASLSLIYNMSDRLYTYEPGNTEIKPQLATALPKVSTDGLTYTIPIREGVVFHDGTPFNAEAMAFSIERFVKNKGKPSFLLSDIVDSAKATSEHELTIKLKHPFAAFPSLLAFSGVCAVSPKAYEIGEGKYHPNTFIGTGPYKLTKYGPDSLQFDIFEKYWGQKPANDGVNVQILSSSVNLYNSFQKQAVDVAYLSMDPDQIRSLQESGKKGDWQVIPNQASVVSYIAVNRNQKPLDNPAVRQAIAAMISRPILYDRVLYGQAQAVYSLIPATFSDYKPVFQQRYGDSNISMAKELLQKAGFTKENPAKVEIWYPSNSPTRTLTALVLKALAQKNLDGLLQFEVNTVESTTAFKNIAEGLYPTFLLDWYPDFLDADDYIQPFLSCDKGSPDKGCQEGGSQSQGSFYYSDRMNQLITQERQEQNPQTRKQIFAQIQELLATDVPYIPLWQSKDYIFAQNGVTGVKLDPTENLVYKNIKK